MEKLNIEGIIFEKIEYLKEIELKKIEKYFKKNILPILSPQIIDAWHPFPFIPNKKLHIAVQLESKKKKLVGIIPVPSNINRIVVLDKEANRYLLLEDIILYFVTSIFSMYKVINCTVMCITRNADIDTDLEIYDDTTDYRQHMKKLIKSRSKLSPVRIEIQKKMNKDFIKYFLEKLNLKQEQIFISEAPLDMTYCFSIENIIPESIKLKLINRPFTPVLSPIYATKESIITQVFQKDILLSFPFESMKPFLNLIKEASEDPNVHSIKMTLYRISTESKLAGYLVNAAENGKEVTVLMELRARFDEENNIEWAQRLEEAGCRVIYGTDKFKVHSKICLITYKDGEDYKYITQVGTGNYNEKTAKLYTDLSIITSNEEIGIDADKFFKNMALGNLYGNYSKLWIAPIGFKQNILAAIEEEIKKSESGKKGSIIIKCNSFTDRDIINSLVKASEKNVDIKLIIRGICCIIPKVKNKTDNIRVISIVGRFLEHSRIYSFGSENQRKIYISSGDMMTRNTEHCVEISCPILDNDIIKKIDYLLETILSDNIKARELNADGNYTQCYPLENCSPINSQEKFMLAAEKEIISIISAANPAP